MSITISKCFAFYDNNKTEELYEVMVEYQVLEDLSYKQIKKLSRQLRRFVRREEQERRKK